MSLLEIFKKYINGDDYVDEEIYEDNSKYEEYDNIIIKKNNSSLYDNAEDYSQDLNVEEVIEISEEEKINIVKEAIYNNVRYYEDFSVLEIKSAESARLINFEYIKYLKMYIDTNLEITRELREIFKDNDQWNIAVLNTVLMMIYSYRERSIDVFKDIYKDHKDLRIKCINLLIKVAKDIPERSDEIIDFISADILNYDDEMKLSILANLSKIKQSDKNIAIIQYFYKEYLREGEAVKAYRALVCLINAAEKYTEGHLNFLKALALGHKTINLEKITVIDKDEEKYITIKDLNDTLKLEAALTYYSLSKEDKDINTILNYLREYSLDLKLRERINLIFNN